MRSCGGNRVTSSPKKRTVPEVGGKSPVTQLSSVVLPAPFDPSTARRSPGRTLSVMSIKAASAPKFRQSPPNADNPVRREQHDDEKAESDERLETASVEAYCDQRVEGEGAQDHVDERANERADGVAETADDGDDENVDHHVDSHREGGDLIVQPDHEDSAHSRDKGGKSVGGDAVGGDVVADRLHATGIVAHALQGEA